MTYENITDVPVDEQFINELEKAGASDIFKIVVSQDNNQLPDGVNRNSCRNEVQKHAYWADEVSAEVFRDKKNIAGGFYNALWDGDIDRAMGLADSNNKAILEQIQF